MKIYISTVAFLGKQANEVVRIAEENQLNLEFSSGFPYLENMEAMYEAYPFPKLPHNYFPAPKDPFVLNLASANPAIRQRSIQHCLNGLKLTKIANAPFFAAHAGFCIDPDPKELGKKLSQEQTYNREENWDLFIASVKEILKTSHQLQVPFLIENNVVAAMNIREDGDNPLFCGDPDEMLRLTDTVADRNLGILLDTAHLKVSAKTLGFDKNNAVEQIRSQVKGIHHSDNDGLFDTNEALEHKYWFLQHMKHFTDYVHVLEVKRQSIEEIQRQEKLLLNAAQNS